MASKPSKNMITRIFCIMMGLVIFFVSISVIRLIDIAVVNGEKYQTAALEQQLYDTLISAPRGNIYDKNMSLLATSSTAFS